jgi:hypothetical protein
MKIGSGTIRLIIIAIVLFVIGLAVGWMWANSKTNEDETGSE